MIDIQALKNKLPKRAGINGREEYFNSSILVLIAKINNSFNFVLQKRKKHIPQGGEICFPGGGFDINRDSDALHTALRETKEEMGINSEEIDVLGTLDSLVSPIGVIVDAFVGFCHISSVEELLLSTDEVEYAITIPINFFLENKPDIYYVQVFARPYYLNELGEKIITLPVEQIGLPSAYSDDWGGKDYKVYVYNTDKGIIWGITARFIQDLVTNYIKNILC